MNRMPASKFSFSVSFYFSYCTVYPGFPPFFLYCCLGLLGCFLLYRILVFFVFVFGRSSIYRSIVTFAFLKLGRYYAFFFNRFNLFTRLVSSIAKTSTAQQHIRTVFGSLFLFLFWKYRDGQAWYGRTRRKFMVVFIFIIVDLYSNLC
jgi:hypothetical protein